MEYTQEEIEFLQELWRLATANPDALFFGIESWVIRFKKESVSSTLLEKGIIEDLRPSENDPEDTTRLGFTETGAKELVWLVNSGRIRIAR